MQIRINGETREFTDQLRLNDLVRELSLTPERIAIELNHRVIRRNEWPETILNDGDRVEIVHFVGGGGSSPTPGAAVNSKQINATAGSVLF